MPQPQGTMVRHTRQAAAIFDVMSEMPAFSEVREIREAVRRAGGRALYRLRPDGFTHHPSAAASAGTRPRSTGTRSGNGPAR